MNYVRQSGEATRGGRASGGASGGAARGSDGGAGARFRRPRRDARRSRLAPDPPSRASARSRGAAEKSKKLAGTKLKRAFERGTVASPGTHRRRLGLGLGLGVLLRHGEKCAGVVRCVGVVAWARTRRERVHRGSPRNRGFATHRSLTDTSGVPNSRFTEFPFFLERSSRARLDVNGAPFRFGLDALTRRSGFKKSRPRKRFAVSSANAEVDRVDQ